MYQFIQRYRLNKILQQFSKKKILVYGDVGIDKYTIGSVYRISPEAPIPIVDVSRTELKLGLAANVADNISSYEAKVFLVGLLGKDNGEKEFRKLMDEKRMPSEFLIKDPSRTTTLKERVVADFQQVVRIDHESKSQVSEILRRHVWSVLEKCLSKVDCVIIEDYAKGLVETSICRQIVIEAEKLNIPVFVDPNSKSPVSLYYGCTVMTPNLSEAEALSGVKIKDKSTLYDAGAILLDKTASKIVIITRGKEGMAVFVRGELEPVLIPTFAREVFDVSGAGDTTIATLALSLVSGANILEAAFLANSAAGVVVGKRGTATTNIIELREYIDFVLAKELKNKKRKK